MQVVKIASLMRAAADEDSLRVRVKSTCNPAAARIVDAKEKFPVFFQQQPHSRTIHNINLYATK